MQSFAANLFKNKEDGEKKYYHAYSLGNKNRNKMDSHDLSKEGNNSGMIVTKLDLVF